MLAMAKEIDPNLADVIEVWESASASTKEAIGTLIRAEAGRFAEPPSTN